MFLQRQLESSCSASSPAAAARSASPHTCPGLTPSTPPPPPTRTTAPPHHRQALAALLPPLSVGLVVTFITVACIIAADTGAYFVGKSLGRTKLTDISPKKTVEGALGGLASAVAAALALRWLFNWPGDAVAAAGYGVLMFFSSIFGDLIESIMKREAGVKVRRAHCCGVAFVGGWVDGWMDGWVGFRGR